MGLLFGMPGGINSETEDVFVAIQTWAGKVDGLGRWVDVAPSATNFSCRTGSWQVRVGDIQIQQYSVLQDLMLYRLSLFHTTTTGIGNQLFVNLPEGWACR